MCAGASIALALTGLLIGSATWAADEKAAGTADQRSPRQNLAESLAATSPKRAPLNLLLTQDELRSFISGYETSTGEILTAPIDENDEIVVTAPGERVPMRDPSQDAWGGIAAPFWAIMHPKDAWRIFVPIPPRGGSKHEEPPVPDPR